MKPRVDDTVIYQGRRWEVTHISDVSRCMRMQTYEPSYEVMHCSWKAIEQLGAKLQ